MQVTTTIEETRAAVAVARREGRTIGFVPTMGFLHAGHLSLIDAARQEGAGFVAVSIFVNPTQFGPNEDFESYPRNEVADGELLTGKEVDLLFLPPRQVMYPPGSSTVISVGGVSGPLEGARRPGHFDGVATVVLKLLNIVQPDLAAFGRKDAQQCAVIERMVRDLDVPVRLVFGETLREPDGLAMSSRNSYLSAEERKLAPVLQRALQAGREALRHGADADAVNAAMHRVASEAGVEVDYLALVDPQTFERPADLQRPLLLAGAVRIGRTRLIDNLRL
ncbi:MAG: pantoate--beta-alanine ligase [Acidobacteria bacterium]|nr:pantoate--beta-alanine ligase [Acidobacteriota bacterium]